MSLFSNEAGDGIGWSASAALVLVVAVLLRAAWIVVCPEPVELVSDQYLYYEFAKNIAAGHGYVYPDLTTPGGWWPVGYSGMLAGFYKLFGSTHLVTYIVNLVLGSTAALGGMLLARALFGARAGLFAGLILACHPSLVMCTTLYASENVAIPASLFAAWLLAVALVRPERRWLRFVLVGAIVGLAAYARATVLGIALAFVVGGIVFRSGWRVWIGGAVVSFGVALLLLLPWGLRNQAVFGKFSPLSLNGSSNLWMGNHPGTDGGYRELPDEVFGMGLVEREEHLGAIAKQFIKDDPLRYLGLCVRRTARTLRSDTIGVGWNEPALVHRFGEWVLLPLRLLCTGYHHLLLLVFTVASAVAVFRWRVRREQVYLWSHVAAAAAPFVLIVGGNRYHLPMMAFVAVFVGDVAARWLAARSRPRGA